MSQSACPNVTLYHRHYAYLHVHVHVREDMVQIAYAPLEASAVGMREVHGCTHIRVRLTDDSTWHNTVPTCTTSSAGVKFVLHA